MVSEFLFILVINDNKHKHNIIYRVFQYLSPPPSTAKLGNGTYENYIFSEPYIDSRLPCKITYSAIYLLPVLWFMCQGRAHFHEHFLTVFLGWLPKNSHEIVNNWISRLYHISF